MRFLRPEAAWLFLLLLPLLAIALRRPTPTRLILPSLALWGENAASGNAARRLGGLPRLPRSLFLTLAALALLILALMSPVSTEPQTNHTAVPMTVFCAEDLMPPVMRVLENLDDVLLIGPGENPPDNSMTLTVLGAKPVPPFEKGNRLYIYPTDEVSPSLSVGWRILASDPAREVAEICYTSDQTKSVRFPIETADAVEHFRREGVFPEKRPVKENEELSLWLSAAAGMLLVLRLTLRKSLRA